MKNILFLVLFCSSFTSFCQDLKSIEKDEISEVVHAFFRAMKEQDTSSLRKITRDDAILATVVKSKNGVNDLHHERISDFINALGSKPKDQIWDERISNLQIQYNASIATVWMDYQFYLNDTFLHCGVNVFQLYNDGENWIVFGISDTRKKTNCENE